MRQQIIDLNINTIVHPISESLPPHLIDQELLIPPAWWMLCDVIFNDGFRVVKSLCNPRPVARIAFEFPL